jgi:hypothetical protein
MPAQLQVGVSTTAPRPTQTLESLYPGEVRRWLIFAGLPMLAACICVGLAFGTSFRWLYGGAIAFGPGLGVLMIIYLAITSDTNGVVATGAAHDTPALRQEPASTSIAA